MSELLPTVQAGNIRHSLVDYLTTTFGLTDPGSRDALDRFLGDPESGMFKGPYVRLRLPFRPADEGWRESLEWYEGFTPYGHQAAAFARLSSFVNERPQPTLVTTGTGSGKTEAFLYPLLDHVLRARREGVTGTKALILYPMNALANDQASRLTKLITGHKALHSVTAALYTGQDDAPRTLVTEDGLITDRGIIRDEPPDILLTNYKMLDQLLLRHADRDIWRRSATSLRYLVLDEFHTYDGAQGTDVAMLLRRLGMTLKSYWSDEDPHLGEDDRARPLGRITPVATSATLGDKGDPAVMLEFAETVFGEPFGPDAVVTESRLAQDEWAAGSTTITSAMGLAPRPISELEVAAANAALDDLGDDPDGGVLARTTFALLYGQEPEAFASAGDDLLLRLSQAHPLVAAMTRESGDAISLTALVERVVGPAATPSLAATGRDSAWESLLSRVVAALGHVRATMDRAALSVEAHLWVRELTRIDRAADPTAVFRWGDDGPPTGVHDTEDVRPSFPALYCRRCGRSGWGVGLAPVGGSLSTDDDSIRRDHANREGRFRPLMSAAAEADAVFGGAAPAAGLAWFSVRSRELLTTPPAEDDPDLRDGWVLPVLTHAGKEADEDSRKDTCPACGQEDGIRFLGSAIATLLSVSLSTLFGSAQIAPSEKKALVFTDSVQDAAHRAGFVQARSHTLTLRAVLREAVADGPLTLDGLVDEVIRSAGDKTFARYRLLAPDCADRESFTPFWTTETLRKVPTSVRTRVRKRLALDAMLEFGLNSRTGRTLELTGSAAVGVEAGQPPKMIAAARKVLAGVAVQTQTDTDDGERPDVVLLQWVRGLLDRMRSLGAIEHPWFERYRQEDGNRWFVTGGRPPRSEGMPAFPKGRPAPGYPRIGGSGDPAGEGLEPVTPPKSWYAQWTSRVLDVSPTDGGRLARLLLDQLVRDGVLSSITSTSGAAVFAIPAGGVVVSPTSADDLAEGRHLLVCSTCRAPVTGSVTTVEQLTDAPCMLVTCTGRLRPSRLAENFYQRLYASPDMRRVVAREHTSLLEDEVRLDYENGFKGAHTSPAAPNVLVATPTLEMGIDIGDLSAVVLASLPRTVASYLQRVGRAGRLTGNALNLAFITGRGEQLPKLGDPLSVINGEVRPPATYLRAEEILRRQYTAHLADEFARDETRPHPNRARGAIGASTPGTFLGDLISHAETHATEHLTRFLAAFSSLPADVVESLRDWLATPGGPGTSAFAAHLHEASGRWQATVEELQHRRKTIDDALPALAAQANSPAATDDDQRALRSAETARKLTVGQLAHLQGEYWIGVLEEYGLLPNYTLLDDNVTLDVGLSWMNPDTKTFQTDHARLQRGSAQAIREFAPGARFYARGLEITIDAVDLGVDGVGIRPWVFCPACGYAVDVAVEGKTTSVSSCPRCGSSGVGDMGQRLDVVELAHVTAEIRRDEATITDRRDQRDSRFFQVVTAADVDPAHFGDRWFAEDVGLGCTYLTSLTIRWVNLGTAGHGATRIVAGEEISGALFRVCEGCGKLDTDAGQNQAHEHRPWCRYRTSPAEHTTTVALSRTLRTQGLLLRLPSAVTIGDDFAAPSLAAALLLGLREQLGGHPDHIRVEHVVDPTLSDGSENHEAILLHDAVPGGTGYLAELGGEQALRSLLATAWERVRDCECRTEPRLACHRCLLPFVAPGQVRRASRASAERHLRTLLGFKPEDTSLDQVAPWSVTKVPPPEDPESHLEQRFRKVFVERLKKMGAATQEVPGPFGNSVRFTIPGQPRLWTLTPQVNLENSRPDFVLETNDASVPAVAIFTDGLVFHATVAHNRLADDASKRQILRDTGRVVVSVSAKDVLAAERGEQTAPSWYSDALVGPLQAMPQFMASPAAYKALALGPVDWLLRWVESPEPVHTARAARAVPMFFRSSTPVPLAEGVDLHAAARSTLLGGPSPAPGDRLAQVWRSGALAVAVELSGELVSVAVVLDDRDSTLDAAHADSWRAWLRLSNALALRDWPTVVTTTTLADATAVSVPVTAPAASDTTVDLDEDWARAVDEAQPGSERELVLALATAGVSLAPVIGDEGPDGIMIDVAWPSLHVVVATDGMAAEDRTDLEAAGWIVVPPDPAAIIAELSKTGAGREGSE
ncbi:DEAD/DEAH box helicase [Pseudonocardia yuanmonensis]|uniref:DEAD/DEAH box helicase n=1 Tax=Pseudonocardia yuanmonensis TaxID=1095914 RepID=A0ABP8W7H7_9PSEU